MANLADLVIKVTSDVQGVQTGMAKTRDELQKTEREASKWGAAMNTAANYAAGAALALTGVIAKSTKTYMDYGASIDDITDMTNLSAESASILAGQLKGFGIQAGTAATGVKFFEKNLDAARQGSAETADAFARLGISSEELKSLGDAELLTRVRDEMSQLGDTTEQTGIAMKLFGRSGADLADWYQAAPDDIAKVNEAVRDAGLVWDDKKLQTWQDMVDAQREFTIAMTGLQIAVVESGVIDSLAGFVGVLGDLLRAARPLMPVLPYLTIALWGFSGAVKLIRMAQFITDLGSTADGATKVTGGLRGSIAAMGAWIKRVPALVAANATLIASFAVVAVGIYAIVKAYQAWQDAANQAATAATGAQTVLDAHASNVGQAFVAQKQADINRDAYKSPEGVGGWLQAALEGQVEKGILSWMQTLPHFADGGVASAPVSGGLAVLHGVEKIAPLDSAKAGGKDAGRGDVVFKDCTFSARSPRELMDLMKRELARDVRYANG